MTQNEALASLFRSGGTITAAQAKRRFGIKNLRARVDELRKRGLCIFTSKTNNGYTSYRLGSPTREMVSGLYQTLGGSLFKR